MPITVTGSDASSPAWPASASAAGTCSQTSAASRSSSKSAGPADGEEPAVGAHVGRDDEFVGAGHRLHDGLEDAEGLPPVGAEPVEQERRHASAPGR